MKTLQALAVSLVLTVPLVAGIALSSPEALRLAVFLQWAVLAFGCVGSGFLFLVWWVAPDAAAAPHLPPPRAAVAIQRTLSVLRVLLFVAFGMTWTGGAALLTAVIGYVVHHVNEVRLRADLDGGGA